MIFWCGVGIIAISIASTFLLGSTRAWFLPATIAIAFALFLLVDSRIPPTRRTDTAIGEVVEVASACAIILVSASALGLRYLTRRRSARLDASARS